MKTPKLIAVKNILHRADSQTDAITREEFIAYNGKVTVSQFWHNLTTGKLLRVTSRELHPGEVIPNN